VLESGVTLFNEREVMQPDGKHTYIALQFPLYDVNQAILPCAALPQTSRIAKSWKLSSIITKDGGIGRLAGGIAHDFNNLLTAIMGYAELAELDVEPASPIIPHLQTVQQTAQRAAALTRQLLAFARKQIQDPQVFSLNDLIVETDKLLRRVIGEDIELVTLPSANLQFVKADPNQLTQVLVNLAVNARDAMPDGGKLTIETHMSSWMKTMRASMRRCNPALM